MPRHTTALILASLFLVSCGSVKISPRKVESSDPKAIALVAECVRAHGWAKSPRIRDVSVRYEGEWAAVSPRFQPTLVDTGFRRGSEERLLLSEEFLAQMHRGPKGEKNVVRSRGEVSVAYNGKENTEREVRQAAALVADAYAMFLLGPTFFQREGVSLVLAGEGSVGDVSCDQVLAVLTPGLGEAKEDRVILSIDRNTRRLLRVRMTLNSLESTQGAEVDVTFSKFCEVAGRIWPTEFHERVRAPFDLPAHHWRLMGLDVNRGFNREELLIEGFKGSAARPATPLP